MHGLVREGSTRSWCVLPLGKDNVSSPIFIVGCGRSGTTLLRLILNRHRDFAIFGESGAFFRIGKYSSLSNLKSLAKFLEDWSGVVSTESPHPNMLESEELRTNLRRANSYTEAFSLLMKRYATLEKKTIWGEKTPAHVHKIDQIVKAYPKARIIHLTRDPRAVVSSTLESFEDSRVDAQGAYGAAMYWVRCEQAIERARTTTPQLVKLIRYEDMVTNPESVARDLCNFVGVEFDHEMLDFAESSLKYAPKQTAEGEVLKFHAGLLSNINTAALDKWKNRLSDEMIAIIQDATAPWLLKRGYRMHAVNYSPSRSQLFTLRMSWLASEVRRVLYKTARGAFWRARAVLSG